MLSRSTPPRPSIAGRRRSRPRLIATRCHAADAAIGPVAVTPAPARGRFTTDLNPEEIPEQSPSPREILKPGKLVSLTTQPGIREMIKEPAEHHLAVSPVLSRIQHVRMPDLVDPPPHSC